MTKYSLAEISSKLESRNYVGGGTNPKFDRTEENPETSGETAATVE